MTGLKYKSDFIIVVFHFPFFQFVTLETCITAFVDEFKDDYPWLNKHRFFVVLGTCIGMLLIGLPLTMQVHPISIKGQVH